MPAGTHLPYGAQIDDYTLQTRDGMLLQTVRLRGLLFETADTTELNYRLELGDAILQAIGSPRFALYHHVIRRRVEATLRTDFTDAFSAHLDAKWRARMSQQKLYVNELYLTLVRRPLLGRIGILERVSRWLGRSATTQDAERASDLRALNAARDALIAALSQYDPKLLQLYETDAGVCSEPLEFLSSLFNGAMQPVQLPNEDVGHYLPYRRVSFGQGALELAPHGELPRRFSAIMSIKDYAAQTSPGMFDGLLRLPIELTVTQSFAFVQRTAALSRMNLTLRRLRSTEDEALSLRDELVSAKDAVAAGRAGFGEHHMTVAVHGNTLTDVDRGVAEVSATLADLGMVATREDIGLEPS